MATSLTTVTGRLLDPAGQPVVNEYVYFYLRQAGADNDITPNEVYSRGDRVEAQTDSSGDISVSLWVNGDSDIQSLLLIETKTGKIDPTLVIIPTAASGGTIDIAELLINHVASGSTTQQSSVLDEAKQYTDALAADPSSNASFSASEWKTDLGVINTDGGGQLGLGASSTSGGSVGSNANTTTGGAVGFFANTTTGGAVGFLASSTDGFAGGSGANAGGTGRVQLGTGTNSTDSTIQFLSSGSITASQFGRLRRMGFVDYNNASGDVSLTSETWTDVPNDTLGSFTNVNYIPSNVTSLIDDSTGYLDFTELELGQEISVRNDFTITPNTNNALLQVRYVLGTGAGEYALLFWSERLDSGSGIDYQRVITFPIYMGDTNTRDNPGKLQVKLSTPGTLNNSGSYISVR